MLTLRISVWGNGIVGGTYADYLEDNGFDVRRIDPGMGLLPTDDDYLYPSIICVPAPTLSDGIVDCSIISDIAGKIFAANEETPILVKSTIPPNMADDFSLMWKSFTYSPEFLTAAKRIFSLLASCRSLIFVTGFKANCSIVSSTA